MPSTIRLHRVLTTTPDKLYRAFLEPDALAKWLPPDGFACTVHSFEAEPGGSFRMSFRNFTTGASHAFGGEFVELVPGERVVYTDRFDEPNLPGEMRSPSSCARCRAAPICRSSRRGVPDLIPEEACYLGWQQSLANLAHLVEPDIPQ